MNYQRHSVGEFRFEFHEGDIFRVYWREIEIIQRIYVAVRDASWNTIPGEISNLKVVHSDQLLELSFDAHHLYADIDFSWKGNFRFSTDNSIELSMSGEVTKAFKYCKIGFNIHHGLATHAGLKFVSKSGEQSNQGDFGPALVPQLVKDGVLTAMTPVYDDLLIKFPDFDGHFTFRGDLFEMQDHRNWGDDNWKSYGTPLAMGFPFDAAIGERIEQRITFRIEGATSTAGRIAMPSGIDSRGTLPLIGINVLQPLTPMEQGKLQRLFLDHLRVSVNFSRPDWDLFDSVTEAARELSCGVEVALSLPLEADAGEIKKFVAPLYDQRKSISRILIFAEKSGYNPFQGATDPQLSEMVKNALPPDHEISIFSGTDQFFSDLNRLRPDYSQLDGVVLAYNPQVHAGDDLSILQNASPVRDISRYIQSLYGDKKIVMSPVEFLGAGGPYPQGPARADGLPANVDPRFWGELGAHWTAALLAHAAVAQVHSVTLYEVSGARGVLGDDGEEREVFKLLESISDLRTRGFELMRVRVSKDNAGIWLYFSSGEAQESAVIHRGVE